jgi:hypothetical protein
MPELKTYLADEDDNEIAVDVEYDYEPAFSGTRDEPAYGAEVDITAVTGPDGAEIRLTDEQEKEIADECHKHARRECQLRYLV